MPATQKTTMEKKVKFMAVTLRELMVAQGFGHIWFGYSSFTFLGRECSLCFVSDWKPGNRNALQ